MSRIFRIFRSCAAQPALEARSGLATRPTAVRHQKEGPFSVKRTPLRAHGASCRLRSLNRQQRPSSAFMIEVIPGTAIEAITPSIFAPPLAAWESELPELTTPPFGVACWSLSSLSSAALPACLASCCTPLLGEDCAADACLAGLAKLPPTFAPAELAPLATASFRSPLRSARNNPPSSLAIASYIPCKL